MPRVFLDLGAPPPLSDAVVNRAPGVLTVPWQQWMSRMPETFHAIPSVINSVVLNDQEADIAPTDLAETTLTEGIYRVCYFTHIHRPATGSSSLVITIAWTDDDGPHSKVGATINGNSQTTSQDGVIILYSAPGELVTYEVAYNSVGATTMQYIFCAFIEQIR